MAFEVASYFKNVYEYCNTNERISRWLANPLLIALIITICIILIGYLLFRTAKIDWPTSQSGQSMNKKIFQLFIYVFVASVSFLFAHNYAIKKLQKKEKTIADISDIFHDIDVGSAQGGPVVVPNLQGPINLAKI